MSWWYVLESAAVTWPPAAVALWLSRGKLHRLTDEQTRVLAELTDEQTDWLRPGWKERRSRP